MEENSFIALLLLLLRCKICLLLIVAVLFLRMNGYDPSPSAQLTIGPRRRSIESDIVSLPPPPKEKSYPTHSLGAQSESRTFFLLFLLGGRPVHNWSWTIQLDIALFSIPPPLSLSLSLAGCLFTDLETQYSPPPVPYLDGL